MSSPNNNNNNNKDVYTAVSIEESNNAQQQLNKPLLSGEESSSFEKKESHAVIDASELNASFRFHGLVLGFLAQVINVTGTTYMYYRWEGPNRNTTNDNAVHVVVENNNNNNDFMEGLLHGFVWVVTQVDLYLYIAMWISLTAVLTRTGMDYVRNNFFVAEQKPTKRSIFVLGVQFYVGVVLGVFFAWTGIDMLLGLPVPVMPMIGVLMFGLLISYTMVWCYDLEDGDDEDEEDGEEGTFVGV